jgi:hypothetical protein
MSTDRAGNSLNRAKTFQLSSNATFKDKVGGRDRSDFLRFTLDSRSSTNFTLTPSKSDVNLQLLDSRGQLLSTSARKGKTVESIKTTLEPGTYFLKIYPGKKSSRTSTSYSLSASTALLPNVTPTPSPTPVPTPIPTPAPIDSAGNQINAARNISVGAATSSYSDWVGGADPDDFYQFTTDTTGGLTLNVTGLATDANVRLIQDLNKNGIVEESEVLGNSLNLVNTAGSISKVINTGIYFIQVTRGGGDTDYTLSLSVTPPVIPDEPTQTIAPTGANANPSNASGDPQIDGIVSNSKWGFSWGDRTLTYSFYEDSVFGGTYYGAETGVREVSERVKSNVRSIFKNISSFVNVNFQEVTESSTNYGRLRFMVSNAPKYAYAYYPHTDNLASVAGDVHLSSAYDVSGDNFNGFQNSAGSHGYMSLIHEIGHAMGLKHPHEDAPLLPEQLDNTTNTVMTYNFSAGSPAATAMPLDIKALQYLYGSRSHSTADSTYLFTDKVDQYLVDGQQFFSTVNSTKQTIWDTGGIDTLDFSNLSIAESGYRLDMNPSGILTTNTAFNTAPYKNQTTSMYGTVIANNVLVEKLINSGSNDTIFANSAANTFSGYSPQRNTGNDVIWNASGQDTLDLLAYTSSDVSQSRSGNDLVVGLGSNRSVTVKNYYTGSSLNILLSAPPALPTITISANDPTASESITPGQPAYPGQIVLDLVNSGQITLTRTGNLASSLQVGYTLSGTSTSGVDYISPSGTAVFNSGASTATVFIIPFDDQAIEGPESIVVNLANGTGYSFIAGSSATITLEDNDFSLTREHLSSTGAQGNAPVSFTQPSISANGRYVAFYSAASNLVPDDTNGALDVFVRDRYTGVTQRVSVSSNGVQSNSTLSSTSLEVTAPSISADGRYITFVSDASNLVANDTNGKQDIFVHDRQTRQTTRVNVSSTGQQANDDSSNSPSGSVISTDGRYVAFVSSASNLVAEDTNGWSDVFVHDRQTGQTQRVSVASTGTQGNFWSNDVEISADGRYVAFSSLASNFATGDTNQAPDVFIHDRQTGQTTRVSISSTGVQGDLYASSYGASLSENGRYIAFYSQASNLVTGDINGTPDVFVHDRQTGQTQRVSITSSGQEVIPGGGNPSISADGRYVAFYSVTTALIDIPQNSGFQYIFIHDRLTGQTKLVSRTGDGLVPQNHSDVYPAISANGQYVAFGFQGALIPEDTNGVTDIYVQKLWE